MNFRSVLRGSEQGLRRFAIDTSGPFLSLKVFLELESGALVSREALEKRITAAYGGKLSRLKAWLLGFGRFTHPGSPQVTRFRARHALLCRSVEPDLEKKDLDALRARLIRSVPSLLGTGGVLVFFDTTGAERRSRANIGAALRAFKDTFGEGGSGPSVLKTPVLPPPQTERPSVPVKTDVFRQFKENLSELISKMKPQIGDDEEVFVRRGDGSIAPMNPSQKFAFLETSLS